MDHEHVARERESERQRERERVRNKGNVYLARGTELDNLMAHVGGENKVGQVPGQCQQEGTGRDRGERSI